MQPSLRNFRAALIGGWTALAAAGWFYARERHIAVGLATPLALAFLTEYAFYLLPGFSAVRTRVSARFSKPQLAWGIAVSSILPYLIYSLPSHRFEWGACCVMAILSIAVAFWFVVWPRSIISDLLFLFLIASVILSGLLKFVYPDPVPKLPIEVLGHITLIRSSILAVLLIRGDESIDFGFLPRWRDLRIGTAWFLAFLAIGFPLARELGQLRLPPRLPNPLQAILIMLGILWVVALSEEFFFRALLQQWLSAWSRSTVLGLVAASLLFGACHLVKGWRFAVLAAVAGLFYGAAFQQTRSMKTSMVTHALTVGTWRLFFS